VEAIELAEDILKWLLKGHTLASVFRMYRENGAVSGKYHFKTFRKAVAKTLEARGYRLVRNALPVELIMAAREDQTTTPPTVKPKIVKTTNPSDLSVPRDIKIDG
jgi:hypothetical protein